MKKNRIDLHTHSNCSDGTLSPTQLVQLAWESGLTTIALTDHDTVSGLAEAQAALDTCRQKAPDKQMELIHGIEISTMYHTHEFHIVGLYLLEENTAFLSALEDIRQRREGRNGKIIAAMQNAGIDITMEKLIADQGNGVLTRANFARYLLNYGYITSISEAFDRYLGEGMPFFVPRQLPDPQTAINLIHSVSGLAFLAHPLAYHLAQEELSQAVANLKDMGIDGMETYYSTHHGYDTVHMKALARKNGLILSGGSDFHGSNKPHIGLGKGCGNLYIPENVPAMQKELLQKKRSLTGICT